jgi:hypothetical protein
MYYEEDYEEQGGRAGDDHSATTKQQDLQGPASRRSSSSTLSEPDSSSFVLNALGTGRREMDWPDGTLSCLTLRGSAAWGPRSGHVERRSRGMMRTLARFGLHVMPLMILAGGVHCWWRKCTQWWRATVPVVTDPDSETRIGSPAGDPDLQVRQRPTLLSGGFHHVRARKLGPTRRLHTSTIV